MPLDYERAWLEKFKRSLDRHAGANARQRIMEGSADLSDQTPRDSIIEWSIKAMERLELEVDPESAQTVMLDCGCQYPQDALEPIAREYQKHGDIDQVIEALQERFSSFLADDLGLKDQHVSAILEQGWGLAGRRDGAAVLATKIPKSGYLEAYLEETDPQRRREIYCHCPRIRDAIAMGRTISPTYCYCGGGFYKGLWERILGREVKIELIRSILKGDDVCQFRIHLG